MIRLLPRFLREGTFFAGQKFNTSRLTTLNNEYRGMKTGFSADIPIQDISESSEGAFNSGTKNYEDHIPLSFLQRTVLTIGSGLGCLLRPHRGDLISTFGEVSGGPALRRVYQRMLNDPVGLKILSERPRIRTNTVDLDYLRGLPDGTLGRAYTTFLDHYSYSPDDRHSVRFVDDPDLAYVMQRYREIHDLVHTMLEQPTNMLGEVVVKWVEGLQTGLPLCLTGGYFGALRLAPKQTENYLKTHLDYALRVGLQGHFLMCVYFEDHWEENMAEFRASLNIPPPPPPLKSKPKTTQTYN